jgi:hypothetical protein
MNPNSISLLNFRATLTLSDKRRGSFNVRTKIVRTHRLKSPVLEIRSSFPVDERSGNERKGDVHLGVDLDWFLIERDGLITPLLHRVDRGLRQRRRAADDRSFLDCSIPSHNHVKATVPST